MYSCKCAVAVLALLVVVCAPALAQWTADPNVNTPITVKVNDQVQSKVRPTPDGGCYIAWFDNQTGGYDTYIQRLDPLGYTLFPAGGICVADLGFSSTQDYGFEVDGLANAYLAFRDDRSGTTQVTANVVAPDGTLVWGAGGVQLANSTNGNSPRLAITSTGLVVGWSLSPSIILQKLDANGLPLWGAGVTETLTGFTLLLADLQPSEDGGVIALWVRGGSYSTPRYLHAQKYDANGNRMWNGGNPVVVFDGSSVQMGYFPTFVTDGASGAVFSWYETGSSRNAYVQHVNVLGAELFPHNGVAVDTTASRYRLNTSHAYNPDTGDTLVFWVETNTTQSAWGVYGQKITSGGLRAWGDTGLEVTPLDAQQESFVQTVRYLGGAMAFWFDNSGSGRVLGTRVNADGTFAWSPTLIQACSLVSSKSRLNANRTPAGMALLTWGDSRGGDYDTYAQNVWPDGTLGPPAVCPGDANCDGDVSWRDIDYFVAAMTSEAAWEAMFLPAAPTCPFDNNDANADGAVNWRDIDPLVAVMNTSCP